MPDQTINLEEPKAEEKIKGILHLKDCSFPTIIKSKLLEVSLIEIIAHLVSLVIVIPYIVLMVRGVTPIEVYDTISKLVIGAYIGSIFKS